MKKLIQINEYLEKVNASDIKCFDLRGVSSLFDFVFIATVDVARQASALVDYINKAKKTNEIDFRNMNGEGSNWTLVDLNDILLNIFTYEERIHYDLERLYIECPQIDLSKFDSSTVVKEVTKEVVVEITEEIEEVEGATEVIEVVEEINNFVDNVIIEEEEQEPSHSVNVDLEMLTIPGLKALCKQYGVKGYSTLKKAELVEVLKNKLS